MKLVKPSFEIMAIMNGMATYEPLHLIEQAGRTCYKSEAIMTKDTSEKFIKMIRDRGHHSVLEHSAMSVKFVIDRGVSHELVRHRLCAFSQESTRYCNYKSGVTFVIPPWITDIYGGEFSLKNNMKLTNCNENTERWFNSMGIAEQSYLTLLKNGWTPQQARSVLPNSLKTEIIVTANFREWRHIFTLRCSKAAHPQMREIMIPLHEECKETIPMIFDDINY